MAPDPDAFLAALRPHYDDALRYSRALCARWSPDEAEDVLRVLGEDREGAAAAEQAAATAGAGAAETPAGEAGAAGEATEQPAADRFAAHDEDAELLDEESSDPEIQLDLARAYISMGDKEAARVILEEVVNNGSDEQQAEARKMLDVLS